MSKNKINAFQFLQSVLAMLVVIFLCVSFFTACGSADATAKKEKAKKSKAKQALLNDDEEESEKEAEHSEEKTSETHSNPADANKESEKAASKDKNADKKDAKHSDKESSKTSAKDKEAEAKAIWADLMRGNKRFAAGRHTAVNYSASRIQLVKGQHPQVIVLGCSDSRVPPEFVFDKNLGELFIVRDAGNIADTVSLGSIEYAVEHLHSKVLLILGHESCDVVAAAVSGKKMPTKNLRAIVDTITPAFEDSTTCKIGEEVNVTCVKLNIQHSSEDVVLNSPIIKKAVEEGELTVIRAFYQMETGNVVRLD